MIVHTGNGRAFQTGVDVSEIAGDGVGMQRYRQSMEEWDVHFTAWHQGIEKPVITAVNGKDVEDVNRDPERDRFMTAEEAKDYGIVDDILTKPVEEEDDDD